jgi:hypothetical protein
MVPLPARLVGHNSSGIKPSFIGRPVMRFFILEARGP